MPFDPDDVEIRVAAAADVGSLVELRTLWTGGEAQDQNFEQRMAAWLADEAGRRTLWLAVSGGWPLGMASLFEYRRMPIPGRADARWGYVGNVLVRAGCRNRGIGSALLDAVAAEADERDYARLVVSPRAEALAFFSRAGFLTAGPGSATDVLLVRPGPGSRPRAAPH